jgi:hypothetical protein
MPVTFNNEKIRVNYFILKTTMLKVNTSTLYL